VTNSDSTSPETHGAHRSVSGGLARAAVFGINDGLVSNVSLILGFAGSGVDTEIVRLAGFAGAVAGAISMAAGEWISISAQNEMIDREVSVERRALERNTVGETAELAAMYRADGMSPAVAEAAAADVMANPARALTVHTRAEMGVDPGSLPSPLKGAMISFACFLVGAFLPLLPWLTGASGAAAAFASLALGVIAAALVGAAIGRFAERPIVVSVLRQVGIVLVACAITYAIGEVFDVNMS
jgi:vacuolar iron transporter family protein